jgi:hypothetical protein|tara:strand:+ start:984 stop:1625 length:642 start_codon:yes stop_codon:yes gene_type:complete
MKVKIKKQNKTETFNLIDSWSDVTLESWIKLIDKETGSKTEEAEETIGALSDIPKKLVKELALRDVAIIMDKVSELQSKQDTVLKKVFEIDGVEYAMHPDLSEITLGEYADIETFIKEGIEKNMPELMAVLFRPITEKNGSAYTIAAYDGNITIRAEEMKKMSAEQVQSALVFFWHFVKELSEILPSYLMQRTQEIAKELQTETSQNVGGGSE